MAGSVQGRGYRVEPNGHITLYQWDEEGIFTDISWDPAIYDQVRADVQARNTSAVDVFEGLEEE